MPDQSETTVSSASKDQKFSDFLSTHLRGRTDDEMTAALREQAEKVLLTKKSGTITLKLTLKEESDGLLVQHQISVVEPKVPAKSALYYLHPGGEISRRDPNQPQIPGTSDKELNHG